jgi:uncharacterized protein YdeI (YjbR/CyaY-like superfamily)
MAKKDKRIDAYIAKSAPFARPILAHLRAVIHKGNPEVEETIKWGMPSFDYKGPYCSMAAFREHAVFGFWKASLMKDPKNYLQARSAQGGDAMGHMGRITSLKDLPPEKVLLDFVKQAKKLNDEGIKLPPKPKKAQKELAIPSWFMSALRKNSRAFDTFENFSPSNKREYVEWVTEAKTDETRRSRLETAVEWMSEGKPRNWKYMKK